jgi:hypothetical protein
MTARTKMHLILAAFAFASLAIWGGRHLAYTLDPIVRALHG